MRARISWKGANSPARTALVKAFTIGPRLVFTLTESLRPSLGTGFLAWTDFIHGTVSAFLRRCVLATHINGFLSDLSSPTTSSVVARVADSVSTALRALHTLYRSSLVYRVLSYLYRVQLTRNIWAAQLSAPLWSRVLKHWLDKHIRWIWRTVRMAISFAA